MPTITIRIQPNLGISESRNRGNAGSSLVYAEDIADRMPRLLDDERGRMGASAVSRYHINMVRGMSSFRSCKTTVHKYTPS
jgi:hypothetical protein